MNDLDIARDVIAKEISALKDLSNGLDENFERAIDILLKTKGRIILTGIGKSGIICKKIAATLSSTGSPAFFLHPVDAAHGDLGIIKSEDSVIAISNSGETPELLRIIPPIKTFGIPIIAITNRKNSTLSKLSDVTILLNVKSEACPLGLAPTSSTTATMAIGDAIASVLMVRKNFKVSDFARFHPGGNLGIRLSRVRDIMRKGKEIPTVSETTNVREVIYEISSKKLGATVVTEGKKVKGIITDGDLRRFFERNGSLNDIARSLMTKSPKTIKEDAFAEKAIETMEKHKITVLPVVDDSSNLVGIIHLHDILSRKH